MMMLAASCCYALAAVSSKQPIRSDRQWFDSNGKKIEAHAASVLQHAGVWYWYGESAKLKNASLNAINCYSAPSLAGAWKYEVLARIAIQ